MHPKKTLATFDRLDGCSLRLALVADTDHADDGSTPALTITEARVAARDWTETRTETVEVVIAAHELGRFARLVADAARLLDAADPAPDPERVRSRRTQRAHLSRLARSGDRQAVETLRDFDARNRV